jgi:DnaK suppressor protein
MAKAKRPTKSTAKPASKPVSKPAPKAAPKTAPRPTKDAKASAPVKKAAAKPPGNAPARPKPDGNGQKGSFFSRQKDRLLALRDSLLDSMAGVSKDTLRSRAEGSEASAFGMHQADAGSDAYDRDFALNLLSQEQDALYEIDEALKRIEQGSYGVCEMSGKPIPHPRLEAIPFARFTVECQAELEKQNRGMRARRPVTSLFGLGDDEGGGDDDDDISTDNKE